MRMMKVINICANLAILILVLLKKDEVIGKSIGPNSSTVNCTEKTKIRRLCKNIELDLGFLFQLVVMNPKFKAHGNTANIFLNTSIITKLKKEQIMKRLYLSYKEFELAYFYLEYSAASNNRTIKMKFKIMNIMIQIKAVAKLLKKHASCNPGQRNSFVFTLPRSRPSLGSTVAYSEFLFHFAVALRELNADFKQNLVKLFKSN